jgi:hypothetical protein
MANVKFGLKQASEPAPLWWRRLERAFFIVLVPAFTLLISDLPLDLATAKLSLTIFGFITSLVKGIGVFLGNGQMYVDRPTHLEDNQND